MDKDNLKGLIIILSTLLMLLILLKIYNRRENMEGFATSDRTLLIAKADWCGHCKKAAPEFKKLQQASPITLKDGSKVAVKIIDADKDKDEIAKYNIKGFPSILILSGSDTTEYPGERTMDGVVEFMNSNF